MAELRGLRTESVEAVVARLSSTEWRDQVEAAEALGAFGEAAAPAIPELAKLIGHERVWVVETAIRAMERMGEFAPPWPSGRRGISTLATIGRMAATRR